MFLTTSSSARFRLLADKIKEFKRGLVVCGRNAECWGLDSQFDIGAEQVRQELRNQGVLTFSGIPFIHASATIPEPRRLALPCLSTGIGHVGATV